MVHVSNWEKLKLLIWKNWLIQWSRKIQLAVALLLPIFFVLLIVLLRSLIRPERRSETHYEPVSISDLNLFKSNVLLGNRIMLDNGTLNMPKFLLAYSPVNEIYTQIVYDAVYKLKLQGFQGYPNARVLEEELINQNFLCGIEFDDRNANIEEYPKNFSYTLRFPSELRTARGPVVETWQTGRIFPSYDLTGPRNHNASDGGVPVGYIVEGFLPIQHAITSAYLERTSRRKDLPEILIQRFPYTKYIYDMLLTGLLQLLPFIIMMSFIYPCAYIAKFVTNEKEKQLKEVMKIMGLHNWLHWVAWFIKSFAILFFIAICISVLLKIQFYEDVAIFTYGNCTVILFFFVIYITASICFCFMLATFFSKASTAAAVTSIVWILTYVPYSFAHYYYERLNLTLKLCASLMSNTALGFGLRVIMDFEGTGEGIQWYNLNKPANGDDDLTLFYVMLMLLLATLCYMIICLYVEQIFPGAYGVGRRWYFPFKLNFWLNCLRCLKRNQPTGIEVVETQNTNKELPTAERKQVHFDSAAAAAAAAGAAGAAGADAAAAGEIGLKIRDLTKRYAGSTSNAVDELTMNMYVNEITVLLGHNGAGKTTTIFMLTGIIPPTSGTAIINGHDIRTDLDGARQSLGICPQHNVLFDDMSVRNHIIFFSSLKGIRGAVPLKLEIDKYARIMELEDKMHVAARKLSGGMKRKLSLCCALCGNTRTVLCDEPSSGVDAAARRRLWDLLQTEKIGRTILLTTHHMDEADILGDRIAIMCDGRLQTYDTPFALKRLYGSGYRLICVKRLGCRVEQVTQLLAKYIPNIMPENEIGNELSYRLPTAYTSKFPEMLAKLEHKSVELKLTGFGISVASMEEVFMRVGADRQEHASMQSMPLAVDAHAAEAANVLLFNSDTQERKRRRRLCQKWQAMLLKKILMSYRNKAMLCIQLLVTVLFLVLTIFNARNSIFYYTLNPLPIIVTRYGESFSVLEIETGLSQLEQKIAHEYAAYAQSFGAAHQLELTDGVPFEKYILSIAKDHTPRINRKYLTGATIKHGKMIAWLNNKPLHTAPLTLNYLHNAMARALLDTNVEIHLTNYPLPYNNETLIQRLNKGSRLGVEISVNLGISMCFVTAFYAIPLIRERETRAKLLQFVSGVNVFIYWMAHFIWDFIIFIIVCILALLTISYFQEVGYATATELSRYLLVLLVFGLAALPLTYTMSFCFSDMATGFSRIAIFNLFTGTGFYSVYLALSMELFNIKHIANALAWFFRIFPHFSLTMALHRVHLNFNLRRGCKIDYILNMNPKLRCRIVPICCNIPDYFHWPEPGVLPELVYMLGIALLMLLIILAIEARFFPWCCAIFKCKRTQKQQHKRLSGGIEAIDLLDSDVAAERRRISRLTNRERHELPLVLDRISKVYRRQIAVNKISFCVERSECFGLLGINGAGKSSTFKMLTGDVAITSGRAFVNGICINTDMHRIFSKIGYCPQFDGLLEDLTGREILRIFCLIRGVRRGYMKKLTQELALAFGFSKHLDKLVTHYSGGNKRKLSTAIAMLGNPTVMYLDEPTSGMDPNARRHMWNMVCRVRDAGKSIVLTSHSMEEAEALCTRMAIMVSGEFKCLGSTQHLKNKFSKGLILKIKMLKIVKDNEIVEVNATEQPTTSKTKNRKQQTEVTSKEKEKELTEKASKSLQVDIMSKESQAKSTSKVNQVETSKERLNEKTTSKERLAEATSKEQLAKVASEERATETTSKEQEDKVASQEHATETTSKEKLDKVASQEHATETTSKEQLAKVASQERVNETTSKEETTKITSKERLTETTNKEPSKERLTKTTSKEELTKVTSNERLTKTTSKEEPTKVTSKERLTETTNKEEPTKVTSKEQLTKTTTSNEQQIITTKTSSTAPESVLTLSNSEHYTSIPNTDTSFGPPEQIDIQNIESIRIQHEERELRNLLTQTHYIMKVKQFINKKLPKAQLQDEYQGLLTYYIPIESIKWSELFALIEYNCKALFIEDYTISQTTLEEIFLEFARERSRSSKATDRRKKKFWQS